MNERVRVDALAVGDWFWWSGRLVRLDAVVATDKVKPFRRTRRPARYLYVSHVTGRDDRQHRLHYYDDETVDKERP